MKFAYFFIIFIIFTNLGVGIKPPIFFYPEGPTIAKFSIPPLSSGESSSNHYFLQNEIAQINVTRKIAGPSKDGNLFKSEIIEVIVKVTCAKNGLDSIQIWEIPSKDLIIDNCSYPIRTSSIREMLDYEASDKSILWEIDIHDYDDIIYIKKLLTGNTSKLYPIPYKNSSSNCSEIYLFIYNHLNPITKNLLNKSDSREDLDVLKTYLIKDFNKIINNNSIEDLSPQQLKKYCCLDLDRKKVYSYNPYLKYWSVYNDSKLIKRRLLEQMFPNMIDNLSYYKPHEDLPINRTLNNINFAFKNLYQGETIVFKYYLHQDKLGVSEIRSLIRIKGFLREETIPIKIIERGERFNVNYWSASKDLVNGDINRFVYYIEYLGGNDEQNNFPIKIIAPMGCELGTNAKKKEVNGSWTDLGKIDQYILGKEPKSQNLLLDSYEFSKGKIEEIAVNVTYHASGLRLSPPTISIGNFTKEDFEADISVFTKANMKSKVNYESISILILIITAIISFASIFEIIQSKKLIEQHDKDRDALEKIIKQNGELMEKLKHEGESSDQLLKNNTETILGFKDFLEKYKK